MTQNSGNDAKWKGKRDRDDTPSFIRNVDAKSSILNPDRAVPSLIPVLAVPRSVRIWNQIRWPLAIVSVIIILSVVAYFTNDYIVDKNVEQRLKDSLIGEEFAHVQVMYESHRVLRALSEKYDGYQNVQAAFAWNSVLLARLFNEQDKMLEESSGAFDEIANDNSSIGIAARAGRFILTSQFDKAESLLQSHAGTATQLNEPRVKLVAAWLELAKGNTTVALEQLKKIRERFPEYLPPLYSLIETSIIQGDSLGIATYSSELLSTSTGNLYGALTSLLVRLPGWNQEGLHPSALKELSAVAKEIKSQLKNAPAVLKAYIQFLDARLAMENGDYHEAIQLFKPMLSDPYSLNILAWYGKSIMESSGPREALAALNEAGDSPRIEIYDLRARAYLALYDVREAEKALSELHGNEEFDLSELFWILAVRKGDLSLAKEKMPSLIGRRLQSIGLEMYELLQKRGDSSGIDALLQSMRTGELTDCADAIESWHENRQHKLFHQFSNSTDVCVVTLALRLMRNNYSPENLLSASNRIPNNPSDLRTAVDKAQAIWKTDGYLAASAHLQNILDKTPNSGPLLVSIARQFFEMGQYAKVLEVVSGLKYAEAVALTIQAHDRLSQKKESADLLSQSMQDPQLNSHPAIIALSLASQLNSGAFSEVIEGADAALETAGIWTSEIAELKAMAMSGLGERGDADRYLTALIKTAARVAGMAESWEVEKSIIRINLRRGGNFLFKAVAYTVDMYKSKVEDAEVVFNYGIESQRQGNERGAVRYFNDTIALDPAYVEAYQQLLQMEELSDEQRATLQKFRPDVTL